MAVGTWSVGRKVAAHEQAQQPTTDKDTTSGRREALVEKQRILGLKTKAGLLTEGLESEAPARARPWARLQGGPGSR